MSEDGWVVAMDDADLAEGALAQTHCVGAHVILARVNGEVYAVSDKCVHMACPLARGKLDGYALVCPCHDWRFDVRSGRFIDAPELGLETYPVKSEDGQIYIKLG